jgi:hypothetical protein
MTNSLFYDNTNNRDTQPLNDRKIGLQVQTISKARNLCLLRSILLQRGLQITLPTRAAHLIS